MEKFLQEKRFNKIEINRIEATIEDSLYYYYHNKLLYVILKRNEERDEVKNLLNEINENFRNT